MKNVNDVKTQADLDELDKVLSEMENAEIVAQLVKYREMSENNYNKTTISEECSEGINDIYVCDDYVYINLNTSDTTILKKIKTMWETQIKRTHERLKEGKEVDYLFTVDLLKTKLNEEKCYILSVCNPLFCSLEGGKELMLVSKIENIYFGEENVSVEELEYEMMLEDEMNAEIYHDFEQNDISNESVIGTKKYEGYNPYLK